MEKYVQIANALTEGILTGKYVPLGPIPSERALMNNFGVARETVHKALNLLDSQRLIYRRPGRISVVSATAKSGKNKIGVMISGCMYTEIFRSICDSIRQLAEARSVDVVFGDASSCDFDGSGKTAFSVARKLIASGVRGVILQPVQFSAAADRINRRLVRMFRDADVEIVLVDCDVVRKPVRSGIDLVDIDNFNAGRIAASHIVSRGAKRIVVVARKDCANTVLERIKGIRSVADKAEVECLCLKSVSDCELIEKELSAVGGFDAVIAQNDIAAVNVMTALRNMGLHVPTDVMLVGFDDVVIASRLRPGLTSVHQPCDDIAAQSFSRLLARIEDPSLPPIHIHCHETLVVRGSTERKWR